MPPLCTLRPRSLRRARGRAREPLSLASGSASPPDSGPAPLPRPLGPQPFFFLLTPASRGKGKPRARTSAPPSGLRREPRCTAPALRWASGAAAPGSRLSRCCRRRCNGHRRRLHLLLLPQRPLRRESYITRGQSLLGNVVPSGLLLKGDWAETSGGKSGRAQTSACLIFTVLRHEVGVRTQGFRGRIMDSEVLGADKF